MLLRDRGVGDEELTRAKEHLKGRMVLGMESTGARMARLARSLLFDIPLLSIDEMLERIDAVTADDVAALAGRVLRPRRALGGVYRAERRALPQRRRLGQRVSGGVMIKVAVSGAAGRMGETVCEAVEGADDMEVVGRADPRLAVQLTDLLADAEVVVDFTTPDVAPDNVLECVAAGVHVVLGTTGFDLEALGAAVERERTGGANLLVAPNFAIGAVLLMELSRRVVEHMPECEIVELHHEDKVDAPSGTAKRTAELISEAGGRVHQPIHSIRLPGLVAHQEVIFGGEGQTLSIRHDTSDRSSFMPGVLLAVRHVGGLQSRSPWGSSISSRPAG